MDRKESEKLAAFYAVTDENGVSNAEKAATRCHVIRRVAETDRSKSYEDGTRPDSPWPVGMVVRDGRLIGLGIHIFNEDIYPLQSFEIYLRGCDLVGCPDLSASRDLVFVDLYRNRLDGVTLGQLPALRIFGVQDNAITQLDVTGLTACQGIDAGKNRLRSLDVRQNAALVELYVNDNQLTEIDLSGNPCLKYFYCHNNAIMALDTTGNPLLRHLDATGNPLRSIRALAPQSDGAPLCLAAGEGGTVGLRFAPVYNAQWKETGEWRQSYYACPQPGYRFVGWTDETGTVLSTETVWNDAYGASRVLTAVFAPQTVTLDLTAAQTAADVWQTLRDGMAWQDWYGSNLDALFDVLTGLPHAGRDFLLLRCAAYDDPAVTHLVGQVARVFANAAAEGTLTVTVRTVQSEE